MSSLLAADGRFSGHAISNGLRIRLNTIRVAVAFLTAGWRLGPIRWTRSCGWMVAVIWIASSGSGAVFPTVEATDDGSGSDPEGDLEK